MPQRNLFWPLGVVVVFLLAMAAALTGPPELALRAQSDPCREGYPVYPVCATQTAQANSNAATSTLTPTATSTATPTSALTTTATATGGATTTATSIGTATTSTSIPRVTPTIATTTTRTVTAIPRPTRTSDEAVPTATATVEIVGDLIACIPDKAIELEGEGPPNSALLLYFNQRAVGGGLTDTRGYYLLRMIIGAERPGFYPVAIQVRDTREVLRELTCEISETTPTPSEEGL